MKLYKYKEPNIKVTYMSNNEQVVIPETYIEKEVRAMWVSNVANIDLPTIEDLDEYKRQVLKIFDTCEAYHINLIYFQIRTNNDAFYQSKINPTSRYLVGKEGNPLKEDILKWVIDEAHHRKIELHGWCNPYRVSMGRGQYKPEEWLATCDPLNLAVRLPNSTILDTEGQIILNPAKQVVKDHIVETIKEIIENYEVDGIHFDDYFYPYKPVSDKVNDLAEYEKRVNHEQTLTEFRKDQVTEVIKKVYQTIKTHNPKLEFGVSPFGIWKSKSSDSRGSYNGPGVFESCDLQYADSYKWVKEGYLDYIVPQIYWGFENKSASFHDMTTWWVDVVKGTNVKLYIGHAAYRLGREGEFENKMEIVNQLKFANQFEEVKGNVFFTYHTFIDDNQVKPGMIEVKKILGGKNE